MKKVVDIKFLNKSNHDVTNRVIINTDYAKKFLASRLLDATTLEGMNEAFVELENLFVYEADNNLHFNNKIEFSLSLNTITAVYATKKGNPVSCVIILK